MRIVLTPGQAIMVHGWIRAREYVTWSDILANDKLTFTYLHETVRVSTAMLHHLQPDLQAWIKNKRATLEDCPNMSNWGAHPIQDFKADLADIIRMKWQASQLKSMNVMYDNLLELGMTPEVMILFGYTLLSWTEIGFTKHHCENFPEYTLYRLFMLNKVQVLACMR